MKSLDYCAFGYNTKVARVELRKLIFKDLVNKKRLVNDDNIKLGKGGALPRTSLKKENQAYIIIGLPASGKSGVASTIADEVGAYILDSDLAKRKLPEFSADFGATLVHDESDMVVFGSEVSEKNEEFCLFDYCVMKNANIVIPKIGHDKDSILHITSVLKGYKYDVHLILVSLDRIDATKRAMTRFDKSGRYVPLSLIFDMYSNNPILTYYRIKSNKLFKSYMKLSNNVPKGSNLKLIECSPECMVQCIYSEELIDG
jgi:hypothetical protein